MDIRETMSVLENPFQDIQGIANISSAIINTTSKPTESDNFEDYLMKKKRIFVKWKQIFIKKK